MSATPIVQGAATTPALEFVFRDVLLRGLHELAQDPVAIDEVIGRADTLDHSSREAWQESMRAAMRAFFDPDGPDWINVGIGYPEVTEHLPWIGIINDTGGEDAAGAVVGDTLQEIQRVIGAEPDRSTGAVFVGATRYAPLPDPLGGSAYPAQDAPRKTYVDTVTGIDHQTTLELTCWHPAPEASILLRNIVRWAMFRRKGELQDLVGATEVSLDEGGVTPDERIAPLARYVPVIRATVTWTYRQTLRGDRRANGEGGITLVNTFSG